MFNINIKSKSNSRVVNKIKDINLFNKKKISLYNLPKNKSKDYLIKNYKKDINPTKIIQNSKIIDLIKTQGKSINKKNKIKITSILKENKLIYNNYNKKFENLKSENQKKINNFLITFNNNTKFKRQKNKKLTKKLSLIDNFKISENFKIIQFELKPYYYKPDNSYLSKMEIFKIKNNYYSILCGGVSNNLKENIFYYNISMNIWKKFEYEFTGFEYSRYGFSIFSINNKKDIIIFGGVKNRDNDLFNLYLNDTILINLEKNIFKKLKSKADLCPKPRKFSFYCSYNNSVVIYGGEGKNHNYMNDFWVGNLNIQNNQIIWTKYFIKKNNEKGLILGSMDCIKNNKKLEKFKFSQNLLDYIFIFGGIDNNNVCNNTIKVLNIKKVYTEFEYINVKGLAPEPRFSHVFKYNKIFNGFILYGGKNNNNLIFSDFFIYDFINNNWCKININKNNYNESNISRYNASMSFYKNYIYIFGGINNNGLIDSNFINYKIE